MSKFIRGERGGTMDDKVEPKTHEATVIIPTYNRSQYLEQLLKYIAQVFDCSQVRFFVLDGSDICNLQNEELCRKYNVDYKYYGTECSPIERILDGLNDVQTSIVSILADDDLIWPKGFLECVDFLKKNPEYSVAHGEYICFEESDGKIKTWECYENQPMEQEYSIERLYCLLSHYQPVFYAVYRTEVLRMAIKETLENVDSSDLLFGELLPACIAVVQGKIKNLPGFYYGRQSGTSIPRSLVIAGAFVFVSDFSSRYERVKNSIMKNMVTFSSPHETALSVDLCFANYFAQCMTIRGVDSSFVQLQNFKNVWYEDPFSQRWFLGLCGAVIHRIRYCYIKVKRKWAIYHNKEILKALNVYFEKK